MALTPEEHKEFVAQADELHRLEQANENQREQIESLEAEKKQLQEQIEILKDTDLVKLKHIKNLTSQNQTTHDNNIALAKELQDLKAKYEKDIQKQKDYSEQLRRDKADYKASYTELETEYNKLKKKYKKVKKVLEVLKYVR